MGVEEKHVHGVGALVILVVLLFFFGFLYSSDASITGQAVTRANVPDEYAAPYDVFDDDRPFIQVYADPLSEHKFEAKVQVYQDDMIIKDYGYYFTEDGWKEFSLKGYDKDGSYWKDAAYAKFTGLYSDISISDYMDDLYVKLYACRIVGDDYRCGCKTEDDCGYWFLQSVNLEPLFDDDPKPDLVIDSVEALPEPRTGEQTYFVARYSNIGDILAGAGTIRMQLRYGPSVMAEKEMDFGYIEPDRGGAAMLTHTPRFVGSYELVVELDYRDSIPEKNERNNEFVQTFIVS